MYVSHLHHDIKTIPADEQSFAPARRESEGFDDRRATGVLFFREGVHRLDEISQRKENKSSTPRNNSAQR